MLEMLSHIGSISSPFLIVGGVLYIDNRVLRLKLWITQHFVQKDEVP